MVAATIFTFGCNLRCPYCHNPELITGVEPDDFLPLDEVLEFLQRRRSVLGGICITGGEPLLHDYIPDLVAKLHGMGFKVKVDTNGTFPDRIRELNADYIALDLKLAPERYSEFGLAASIEEAIRAVRASAPEYEFRTTILPGVVGEADVRALVRLMTSGERYVLTAFHPGKTLDPAFEQTSAPTADYLSTLCGVAREAGVDCHVRDHLGL